MVYVALTAAEEAGIDAEIIDLRTLLPVDIDAIVTSVEKTGRCVIVEIGWPMSGFGAEIAYRVQRECLDQLDAPIERVTSDDVPMPYALNLEKQVIPQPDDVIAAVKKVLYLE